ncbi:MAG: 30S ribosomal protein S17 [Chloroflexi bacterium RBG_13_53_26]|nr:MAG: 30S ribosomal protein S17 [Chloroflexi bacterium RBG_13_53_26]
MNRRRRRTFEGRVVSKMMEKTAVVAVESRKAHPLYKKIMKRQARFKVHDESNSCQVGDVVRIVESRPISKSKHWRVAEIAARGEIIEDKPDDSNIQ